MNGKKIYRRSRPKNGCFFVHFASFHLCDYKIFHLIKYTIGIYIKKNWFIIICLPSVHQLRDQWWDDFLFTAPIYHFSFYNSFVTRFFTCVSFNSEEGNEWFGSVLVLWWWHGDWQFVPVEIASMTVRMCCYGCDRMEKSGANFEIGNYKSILRIWNSMKVYD